MSAVLQDDSPETLGSIIEQLIKIRDRRRELAAEDSELVEQFDELKKRVIARAKEEGSTRISSKAGTVILTEKTVPQIVDRDAMNDWILETGNIYLLQSRVNTAAFTELVESGQEVPGVQPFVKEDIQLRSS